MRGQWLPILPDQLQIGDGFTELQQHLNPAALENEDFAGDAIDNLHRSTSVGGGSFSECGGEDPGCFGDCQRVPFGESATPGDTVQQRLSGITEHGCVLLFGFVPVHAELVEATVLCLQFEADLLRASPRDGGTPARSGSEGDVGTDGGYLLWQGDFKPQVGGCGQIGEGCQQSPCQQLCARGPADHWQDHGQQAGGGQQ